MRGLLDRIQMILHGVLFLIDQFTIAFLGYLYWDLIVLWLQCAAERLSLNVFLHIWPIAPATSVYILQYDSVQITDPVLLSGN